MEIGSLKVASAAIKVALTETRPEEARLKEELAKQGIMSAAINYGGEFAAAFPKVMERIVVAAKREKVVTDTHGEEGAVAGAAHEALSQLLPKAFGLNVGGKVAVARYGDHLSVCVVFAVGLLNLNEVAVAIAHRAIDQ